MVAPSATEMGDAARSGSTARKTASTTSSPATTPGAFASDDRVAQLVGRDGRLAGDVTGAKVLGEGQSHDGLDVEGGQFHRDHLGRLAPPLNDVAQECVVFQRAVGSEVHAAALLTGERRLCNEAGHGVRRLEELLQAGAVADESGVLPQGLAQGGVGKRLGCGQVGRRPRGKVQPVFGGGGDGRAATEHHALKQRVRGQAVGAVDTGGRTFSGGVEPGDLGAPVEVGDDAADEVMRGGGHRDRVRRRVETRLVANGGHEARELVAVDRAQVERDCSGLSVDRACHDVARRQLFDEAVAVFVQQRRAGATKRFGEKERGSGQGGGVKLRELHVGHCGAGLVGGGDPSTHGVRVRWWCAPTARRLRRSRGSCRARTWAPHR